MTIQKMATMWVLAWAMVTAVGCASGIQSTQRQLDHGQIALTGQGDSSAILLGPRLGGQAQIGVGGMGDVSVMAAAHPFLTFLGGSHIEVGAGARAYVGDWINLSLQGTATPAELINSKNGSVFSNASVIARATNAVPERGGPYVGLDARAIYTSISSTYEIDFFPDDYTPDPTLRGWMGVNVGFVVGYDLAISDTVGFIFDYRLSPVSVSRYGDLGIMSVNMTYLGSDNFERDAAIDALSHDTMNVSAGVYLLFGD